MDKTELNTEQSIQTEPTKSKKKGLITGLFVAVLVCAPVAAGSGYIYLQSNEFVNKLENLGASEPIKYGQFLVSIGDLSSEQEIMKTTGHFRVSVSNLCNDKVLDLGKVSFEMGHIPFIGDQAQLGWNPDTSQGNQDFLVMKKAKGQDHWVLQNTPMMQTFMLNPSMIVNPSKGQYSVQASMDYLNMGLISSQLEGVIADGIKIDLNIDSENPIGSTGTASFSEVSAGGFVSKDLSFEVNSEIAEDTASEISLKVTTKEAAKGVWHVDFSETDVTLNVGSMNSLLSLIETASKTCSGYLVDKNQKFHVKSELNKLAANGMFISAKSRLSINSEAMSAKATLDFEPKMDVATGEIDLYKSLVYRAETTIPTGKLSQAQIAQIKESGFISDLADNEHFFKTEMTGEQMKIDYVHEENASEQLNLKLSHFLDKKLTYTAQALYLLPYSMPALASKQPIENASSEFESGSNIRLDTDGTTRILIKALN